MSKNLVESRYAIWQLFKRDFLASYKKSFLGASWVLIAPLLGIITWLFLKGAGLFNPGDVGIPYPAYVLIGTTMWGLFMGFFNASQQTLSSGRDIIMQLKFPHELLLFKQTALHLANFVISFMLNIIILLLFKVKISGAVVFFPFIILPLFFLASSIGLIAAVISVVAYDVNRIISSIVGLMLFVTPVIYSDKVVSPWVKSIIVWNPLTYLVCSARDIVIYGRLYHPAGFFICSVLSFVLFMLTIRFFHISSNKIIERLV